MDPRVEMPGPWTISSDRLTEVYQGAQTGLAWMLLSIFVIYNLYKATKFWFKGGLEPPVTEYTPSGTSSGTGGESKAEATSNTNPSTSVPQGDGEVSPAIPPPPTSTMPPTTTPADKSSSLLGEFLDHADEHCLGGRLWYVLQINNVLLSSKS